MKEGLPCRCVGEGKVGRGGSLGLSGMGNSGSPEALAVLCCVAPALGDIGQENAGFVYVTYMRRQLPSVGSGL